MEEVEETPDVDYGFLAYVMVNSLVIRLLNVKILTSADTKSIYRQTLEIMEEGAVANPDDVSLARTVIFLKRHFGFDDQLPPS